MDQRIAKAAKTLVDYSTKVKKGERVIIYSDVAAKDMALECYRLCLLRGALPKLKFSVSGHGYTYYKYANKDQLSHFPEEEFFEIKRTDAVIYIGAPENTRELTNTDPKKLSLRRKTIKRISDWRVEKTRWVIFHFPTNASAQEADMSLSEFEDFVFKSVDLDWKQLSKRYEKLRAILDKGSEVRITGEDTDITLDITGRKAINSAGSHNMPDGEVFTAPVETKTEGRIRYTFPAIYAGREVDDVILEFKKGKVVKATAAKNEKFLKTLIATDNGSGYLGELGIGTNYNIKTHVKQILFDEKIGGTIHLALGMAYKECGGTNQSAIHWDMIKDLRNGGKVTVDGKVIQKDGKFLV
ncbi:MAG: aminopeptidase [Nanoarchaeota archaeon]|nr:aminopeptidase [Nanoarchaeota archaeon]